MKAPYRTLEKAIGYRFRKKSLLELALVHPSFRYEDPATQDDNQRLEYLGDAVLGLAAAEHLFKTNPSAGEGDMSKLRSRLTQDRTLARIAAAIGVGEHLRLGRGESMSGGSERTSNLADAMEAILGAAWLDGGVRAVNKIFQRLFAPELACAEPVPLRGNPKGDLQEHAQSCGFPIPTYETISAQGPEHNRSFTVEVSACGRTWRAIAGSKREAERLAAQQAMKELSHSPGSR